MLLYDWKKISKKSGRSSKRVLTILESMLALGLPRNRFDPIYQYYYEDFSGSSFLVNPRLLLQFRHKWKDKELADYIGLASFRNLGEYLTNKQTALDLDLCPLKSATIENNRLLRIKDNKVYFLYEDYTGEHTWQV
jgi:hypothetical protein